MKKYNIFWWNQGKSEFSPEKNKIIISFKTKNTS